MNAINVSVWFHVFVHIGFEAVVDMKVIWYQSKFERWMNLKYEPMWQIYNTMQLGILWGLSIINKKPLYA